MTRKAKNWLIGSLVGVSAIVGTVYFTSGDTHKTYRTDIFVCGTKENPKSYYQFANEDFNTKWGLRPGDTVAIQVGPNGENFLSSVDLGEGSSNGITLVVDSNNKKEIEIGWIGLGEKATNWKVNGYNKNLPGNRGFLLTDSNHFAFSFTVTGDVEISYCHVNHAMQGIAMYTITGHTYPLNYQRLHSHHNLFENTVYEAEYLGYVHDSPVLMDLLIEKDTIYNSGYDAIQTRNTDTVIIRDCYGENIGIKHIDPQDHGILFGSNSNGGSVTNCTLKNVDGIGIFNSGYGDFVYSCNNIEAKVAGVMTRVLDGDVQNVGRQTQIIKNNRFTSVKGVECYYTDTSKKAIVDIEGNYVNGTINIAPGISKTLINNGLNVVPDCGSTPPPPPPAKDTVWTYTGRKGYWTLGKRVYYKVYLIRPDSFYQIKTGDYNWYKQ